MHLKTNLGFVLKDLLVVVNPAGMGVVVIGGLTTPPLPPDRGANPPPSKDPLDPPRTFSSLLKIFKVMLVEIIMHCKLSKNVNPASMKLIICYIPASHPRAHSAGRKSPN